MKVLAIVPDFIEKPSGGLGEQFRNLMDCLDGEVEYYICAYPEKNNYKNYKSTFSPIPWFPHQSLTTIYGQSMYFLNALEFKEEFDIIHAFDWSSCYAGVLASWHFKKPLVVTINLSLQQLNKIGIFYCHDPNTIDGKLINDLQIEFEHFGLHYANKVIQVSNYYNSFYPEHHHKTEIIHNGLDIDKWVQKNKPTLPGKNKTKFCYIGRASAMKGLPIILQCDIPNDVDFYFIVSDKNAEANFLEDIKNKCNNVNIFHIQGLYEQEKIDFLFEMDSVVMPSYHEPFGIVALEALISKNILITSNTGGIKEITEGLDIYEIKDAKDLLQSINKVKNLSGQEKDKIVNNGRNRALQFDWKTASNKLLNVYNSVISESYNPNKIV